MKTLLLLFLSFGAMAQSCPTSPLCDELEEFSYQCSQSLKELDCDAFVIKFEKSLERLKCNHTPLIIHTCSMIKGGPASEVHYDLLGQLPFAKALKLYTSEKLRKSMPERVAKKHFKRSLENEKELGKTLHPRTVDHSCREYDHINFRYVQKDVKTKDKILPKYNYSEARVGDFVVWDGDVPHKIINVNTKKKCETKLGNATSVFRFKGHDLLLWTDDNVSIVNLHDCEILWSKQKDRVTVAKLQQSSLKRCEPCWNEQTEACLRL